MRYSSCRVAWYALLSLILGINASITCAPTFHVADFQINDEHTCTVTLKSELATEEFLYVDYLSFSADSPKARIVSWKSSSDAVPHFDTVFGETKRIFQGNPAFTITLSADNTSAMDTCNLIVSYYTNKTKQFVQQLIPLKRGQTGQPETVSPAQLPADAPALAQEPQQPFNHQTPQTPTTWTGKLSAMVTGAQSWWFRIAIAFLLGLLLSLTPCIYPMIPITVGILQAQGSKSLWSNFLLALAYSTGLATTFALLGLGAAFAGHMVGALLNNPFVIGIIVVLLVYVALSLFGLYELYIPRSLRNRGQMGKASYISAFLFGAASGTVASPCLSPGLILMLTLVATLKSVSLGFVMLFAFGFGLSMPLLVIGTFSSSLSLLPQAGLWMLEINYLFGFMMLGMAIYFLQGIVAWPLILALGALLSLIAAYFYFKHASKEYAIMRIIHQGFVLLCVALAAFLMVKCATSLLVKKVTETMPLQTATWMNDYAQGLVEARKQNKKLFVDISAPMCSACEAVERRIFSKQQVMQELSYFVAVKLNIAQMTEQARTQLMQQFKIMGAPTILLVDPTTEKVIARWSSELADRSAASFIAELAQYR